MTSTAATRPTRARRPLIASLLITPALVRAGCGGISDDAGSAGAGGSSGQAESSTTITGEGVLDFTAATVDDGTLDATALEGKSTVLWFWTPWCPTCKAEAPGVADVADVAEELEGKIDVVGVAGLGERPAMKTFVEQGRVEGFTHVDDVDGQVWERFGVAAQPAYAFVAADGTVEVVPGALDEDTQRERASAMAL